jgi:hypothetical protein
MSSESPINLHLAREYNVPVCEITVTVVWCGGEILKAGEGSLIRMCEERGA